jgi:long-chain acyl-CoA synthetase
MRFRRLLQDGLLLGAAAHPDRPAVVAGESSLTYATLLDASLRVATGLQSLGVAGGERVVFLMDNTLACSTGIFGALFAGAAFVVVSAQTKPDRLAYIIDDSETCLVLAEGPLAAVAESALAQSAHTPPLVTAGVGGGQAGVAATYEELLEREPATPPATAASGLAGLVYTSGTTGVPKGVMLSHESALFAVDSIGEYLQIDEDDRILSVLPLAFTYGLSQLLLSTHAGATLLLERSFAFPAQTLQRVADAQATVIPAVPTMFATIAAMNGVRAYPSVRCLTNAAAGLPPALHGKIREVFPNASLYRMYGQTECIRVSYLEPGLVDAKPASVGKAIPGTQVELRDESGNPVPPGEVGTLYVRGPHVTPGYWRAPELTAGTVLAGAHPGERVLCTHDLFTIDEDGDLYFVARSDEIIKTRGEKVSPVEVDNVLCAMDGVANGAVAGVPDDLLGEAIRAYVVCKDGVELTAGEVIRHCREHLPSYAVPQEVVFLDELPQTASGKVSRRALPLAV